MKVPNCLFIALIAFAITACTESKSTSGKQKSTPQIQPVTKVEEQAPTAPEPEIFVVNGKEIQLTKGVTTRSEIIEKLGEADMDLETSLRYYWREGGRLYEYVFLIENDILTHVSKSSSKL